MVSLLHLGFNSGLPSGILVLTKMSLTDFGFLNETIMSLLINGLMALDLSNISQCVMLWFDII